MPVLLKRSLFQITTNCDFSDISTVVTKKSLYLEAALAMPQLLPLCCVHTGQRVQAGLRYGTDTAIRRGHQRVQAAAARFDESCSVCSGLTVKVGGTEILMTQSVRHSKCVPQRQK